MKKIISILIACIFLISLVPFIIAEDSDLDSARTRIEKAVRLNGDGVSTGVECEEDEDCPETRCPDAESRCVDGLCAVPRCASNIAIANAKQILKIRKIAEERVREARQNYGAVSSRLAEVRENASAEKREFSKAKLLLRECRDEEPEKCEQINARIQTHAKEYLIKTAEQIIAVLEKIKYKIESSEDLNETKAAEMIADIDERIAVLQGAIETLKTSEEKEEIIEAAELIKREWLKIRVRARLHIGELKGAKIGNIIARAEHLQEKLEKVKENLNASGESTEEIDALLDAFEQNIEDAKESYEKAIELFNQAKGTGNETLVKQAQQHHKDAEQALKEAHSTLKEIVRLIKATEKGQEEIEKEEESEEENGE